MLDGGDAASYCGIDGTVVYDGGVMTAVAVSLTLTVPHSPQQSLSYWLGHVP